MSTKSLAFDSGLTIERARKRAKVMVKEGQFSKVSQAQDAISIAEMSLPWAKAINALRRKSSVTQFMTKSDIQSVMKDQPELTHHGFGVFRDRSDTYINHLAKIEDSKKDLLDAVDECNKACMYLQHLDKRKTVNWRGGSYGFKHDAERFLKRQGTLENCYLSNGAFICAAYFMGFTVKRKSSYSPNACINYSMQPPIIKWERLVSDSSYITISYIRELDRLEKRLGLPRSETVLNHLALL